jgi:ketosteroid isomerase-like protein
MPIEQMLLSKEDIHAIFKPLSDGDMATFFDNVADDVDWTVKGIEASQKPSNRCTYHIPGTFFQIAGHYTSKAELARAMSVLNTVWATPLKLVVTHILWDGTRAAVELKAEDTYCRNGLPFTNEYAWICRFNAENKIVEVRAYMDT